MTISAIILDPHPCCRGLTAVIRRAEGGVGGHQPIAQGHQEPSRGMGVSRFAQQWMAGAERLSRFIVRW